MYKRINELLGTNFRNNFEIFWGQISIYYKLSEDFIREFQDYIDWEYISKFQVLSESFIREFKDKVSWEDISCFQILSESFIREFKDKVDWHNISSGQVLSENFIREFEDRVYWNNISHFQLLSWNFILEFKYKVSWYSISLHQPFIENPDYKKINKEVLKENELYHLYQQTKNRGWFVGYVKEDSKNYSICYILEFIKSKIYWKDLVTTYKVKYFEPIRQLKNV